MDLEQLRIFVDVLRRGSFTAVAQARRVAPSSISRAIEGLERELGARLFQRSTRRLAPTEAGLLWFERVEPLLEELARAEVSVAELSSAARGLLRLTAPVSFGIEALAPRLVDFQREHPGLRVELLLSDAVMDLVSERIDLAIRQTPLADSSLVARKLAGVEYRLCASPAFVAEHGRPRSIEELARLRCLAFPSPSFGTRWLLRRRDGAGETREVAIAPGLTINNGVALKRCALAGGGVALLSDWLVREEIERGELLVLLEDFEATPSIFEPALWWVWPSRSYLPRKVEVFTGWLEARLALQAGSS